MPELNIAELRRLEAEATQGPWEWVDDPRFGFSLSPGVFLTDYTKGTPWGDRTDKANAALIVAMRNALPELLDRLDDLVVENEMLRQVNSSLGHMLKPHGGVDVS